MTTSATNMISCHKTPTEKREEKQSSTIIGDDKTVCQFRLVGNVWHPSSNFRIPYNKSHFATHISRFQCFNCAPKRFQLMTQKCNSIIHFNAHNQTHREQWTVSSEQCNERRKVTNFLIHVFRFESIIYYLKFDSVFVISAFTNCMSGDALALNHLEMAPNECENYHFHINLQKINLKMDHSHCQMKMKMKMVA